jgi:AraC family transcriptional regulator of adaptative response / DNA-3-methyladenine glycosylase II
MFDLNCSPAPVGERLGQAALLRRAVRDNPGVRIPGTWDPFEISVRAILGQQVSVKAATTIAGRIARRFGDVVEATPPLDRLFPTPAQLVRAQLESEGVMPARAETVRRLADAVMNGVVKFDATTAEVIAALKTVRGIGDWTAQYIAMRALGDRDAFMSGDLILRRAAGHCTARELEQKSQSWRPFRSYAVMLLWRTNAGK